MLVRKEAPAVAFKRKMLNKRSDPFYVRRGCTWCNTCPTVPKEERNHRYGAGSCPRFSDGELWRRQNPSKVSMVHARVDGWVVACVVLSVPMFHRVLNRSDWAPH